MRLLLWCKIIMIDVDLMNQEHPWFRGTNWDELYHIEAAFLPEVNGELDTQNFEKFEEVRNHALSGLIYGPCVYD